MRDYFLSNFIYSISIPSNVAANTNIWAVSHNTELEITPVGGTMKPATPKPIAATVRQIASTFLIFNITNENHLDER